MAVATPQATMVLLRTFSGLQDLSICRIFPRATVNGCLLGPLSLWLASSFYLFHPYHLLRPSTSLPLTHRGSSQAREALPSSFPVRVHNAPDNPGWNLRTAWLFQLSHETQMALSAGLSAGGLFPYLLTGPH